MNLIHCLYGEAAQKQSTNSLGRFIVHLLRDGTMRAHLVDPDKKNVDWLRGTSTAVAVGSVTAANVIIQFDSTHGAAEERASQQVTQSALEIIRENKEAAAKIAVINRAQSEARESWSARMKKISFTRIEEERLDSLGTLVEELLARSDNPKYVR